MNTETRGFDIGDRVICIESGVIGEVIKCYSPTMCAEQTMILCNDGRKYHAPSKTFVNVDKLIEEIAKKIKIRPEEYEMSAAMPLTQPLLLPQLCNYKQEKTIVRLK